MNEVGNALFYEFEEFGLNRQLGYASPVDLVERYLDFYLNSLPPHLDGPRGEPGSALHIGTFNRLSQ
jgi:hypothetical protein